jgi:hypothetical protein
LVWQLSQPKLCGDGILAIKIDAEVRETASSRREGREVLKKRNQKATVFSSDFGCKLGRVVCRSVLLLELGIIVKSLTLSDGWGWKSASKV